MYWNNCSDVTLLKHWRIQGGRRGARPPNRINFFCFHIRFCRKVYASEVGTPPMGRRPPNGKSWIRHCKGTHFIPLLNFVFLKRNMIFICTYPVGCSLLIDILLLLSSQEKLDVKRLRCSSDSILQIPQLTRIWVQPRIIVWAAHWLINLPTFVLALEISSIVTFWIWI